MLILTFLINISTPERIGITDQLTGYVPIDQRLFVDPCPIPLFRVGKLSREEHVFKITDIIGNISALLHVDFVILRILHSHFQPLRRLKPYGFRRSKAVQFDLISARDGGFFRIRGFLFFYRYTAFRHFHLIGNHVIAHELSVEHHIHKADSRRKLHSQK